ncbi:MAG: helix-turn-helix transcriptional regulator [Clostridia bacterium]|nr:helix-turn-helix transcriptional regulator [Clostridia bacterium]
MEFSKRLKELRKWANLSQTQLAEATGLTQKLISKYERNQTEPTISALIAIARFFDESTDYLLGLQEF